MTWLVVLAVFLLLLSLSLADAMRSTRSAPLACLGTVVDGLAMLGLGLGVFGGLMALVLGVLPESGLRLVGQSLRDVLVTSAALFAGGLALLYVGASVRRMAAKRPRGATPVARGGH